MFRGAFDRPSNITLFAKTLVKFRYPVEWTKIQFSHLSVLSSVMILD